MACAACDCLGSAIESPRPAELALTEEQLELARDQVHGLEASLQEAHREVDWLREQLAQQRREAEDIPPPHAVAALQAEVDALRDEQEDRAAELCAYEAELRMGLLGAGLLPGTELQQLGLR